MLPVGHPKRLVGSANVHETLSHPRELVHLRPSDYDRSETWPRSLCSRTRHKIKCVRPSCDMYRVELQPQVPRTALGLCHLRGIQRYSSQYLLTNSRVLRMFPLLDAPNTMDAMFGCAQTHSIASRGGIAPEA
jgi:hypothetical protein